MYRKNLFQLQYVAWYTQHPQACLDRHHDLEDNSQYLHSQHELHDWEVYYLFKSSKESKKRKVIESVSSY